MLDISGNSEPEPKLRLLRFVWEKRHETDTIEFAHGLNLLGDRQQAERTIILRLVRYAMGGSFGRIGEDVMRASVTVRLEFLANGQLVTTERGFESPNGKFRVVFGERSLALSPNEMGDFMLDILRIPKVRYQRGDERVLLSFNDLARAFVVDRDFSYTEILSKVFPEQRKEVVKLMFGLTTQEIANAYEQMREAEIRLKRLDDEIRGVERLLSEFNIGSTPEMDTRRAAIALAIEVTLLEEQKLRVQVRNATAHGKIDDGSESTSPNGYELLRSEMIAARTTIDRIVAELAVLSRQSNEKQELRAMLQGEVRKLERQMSSSYLLSTFTFSRCPSSQSIVNLWI